jgi:hypothetical protein
VVAESLERATSADPGKESQLSAANDFHLGISDLKLTAAIAIVATGTESQIRSSSADELSDAPVSGTIKGAAIAKISATWEDEKRTCGSPRLLE